MKNAISSLFARIEVAFANSPKPRTADEICGIYDIGSHKIRNLFTDKTWKDVTLKQLTSLGFDGLHQLSDKAYVYFYPSYLSHSLNEAEVIDSDILEIIVSDLTPAVNFKYTSRRIELFSNDQLNVIIEVLDLCT